MPCILFNVIPNSFHFASDFISRHHFAFVECGRFPISPLQLGQAIRCVFETECQTPSSVETVLWHIRTPRIFVACLVGAALAAAGGDLSRDV